ncbi:MAG: DUF1015 domain-containing protein, partial [Clostridia bacterium]|nr:DUF1015 domain-containing protein [Clostridia bacterium]
MITVKPFSALRPSSQYAKECAALPYDVMSSDEARKAVAGKPYSFLHIDKAEIDLDPAIGLYDERVYKQAADNLKKFEACGVYVQDHVRKFYFYRQVMDGRAQTGIVGCAAIDDYLQNKIKKHELTRADKELDRIRHVETCGAQTGPIFLAYRDSQTLNAIIQSETSREPLYDFVADDGVAHTVWESSSREVDKRIEQAFEGVDALYIADGHHRAASAVKAGLKRRAENPAYNGNEDYNFFLSVIFPADSLKIMDYNRVLRDLNGLSERAFLEQVNASLGEVTPQEGIYRPKTKHEIGLLLGGKWYSVKFKAELCQANSPVERLDCEILQKHLLAPVLGITDPRTDKRIDFVGGIRGLGYLERRCTEDAVAAISMYPVS